MDDFNGFLEDETRKYRRHFKAVRLAEWDAYALGTDEASAAFEQRQNECDAAYADAGSYKAVLQRLQSPAADPADRRQLELLRLEYLRCRGDQELQRRIRAAEASLIQKFNTFRAAVDGQILTDNDAREVLTESRDGNELQATWEASKQQGALVERDVLEIVRMRNAYARGLGFANYHDFALEIQEQTSEEVIAVFDELHERTRELYAQVKKDIDARLTRLYDVPESGLRPWHYQNPFFQEAPHVFGGDLDAHYARDAIDLVGRFYASVGLPIDDLLSHSDLFERKGKSQHAFCNDIDREGDVRVLCNMRNNAYWTSVLLHESGHGVYWKCMDPALPYLLRTDAHTLVTEAVAILFGNLCVDLGFIRFAGATIDDALERTVREQRRAERLVFEKWSQVMVRFERELYANPDQDLNARWWSLVKEYQGIDYSRDAPDWASKIHLATAPAYYHNYQLGHMLAEQLRHAMAQSGIGELAGSPAVGQFLKNRLFDLGKRYRWDETVERAIGERLTPRHWATAVNTL